MTKPKDTREADEALARIEHDRIEHEAEARARFGAVELLGVLDAIRRVALAELAKGPGIASTAWREVADVIAPLVAEEQLGVSVPVAGRQPMMVPRGFKNAIPPKHGAQPLVHPENIKSRADVAAELERVNAGKPK